MSDASAWFRLSRRELIRALLGLAAYLPASLLLAAPTGAGSNSVSLRALGALLDTLLPADDSPSATQLGVDREILEHMESNRRLAKIIVLGCGWLDQQAGALAASEFSLLQPEQREAIVGQAENSPSRSLPRVFFSAMQNLAFQHYYAHAESWQGMNYAGPPQPRGFLDFTRAPDGQAG